MATIHDFDKIDLRVGRIVAAEGMAESSKLLSISVDLGEGAYRTILSGVAKAYLPEDLIDRNVIVVANLEPKLIAGIESDGMLVGIEQGKDGRPALIFVSGDLKPGSKLS